MADITTISSRYQVVIPKSARQKTSLKPGQKLIVLVKGDSITLVPVPKLTDLIGFAPEISTEDYRDEEDRL